MCVKNVCKIKNNELYKLICFAIGDTFSDINLKITKIASAPGPSYFLVFINDPSLVQYSCSVDVSMLPVCCTCDVCVCLEFLGLWLYLVNVSASAQMSCIFLNCCSSHLSLASSSLRIFVVSKFGTAFFLSSTTCKQLVYMRCF